MDKKLYKLMNWAEIEAVVYADTDCPEKVLGAKQRRNGLLLQFFRPDAVRAWVVPEVKNAKPVPMELADEEGYYAVLIPGVKKDAYPYHYEIETADQQKIEVPELYYADRAQQLFSPADEKAFHAGVCYDCYEKLGAHPMQLAGQDGCLFTLWAPHAARVSLIGNFNNWDGRFYPMSRPEGSEIFRLFVPGIGSGDLYKFEIKLRSGLTFQKSDPLAQAAEPSRDGASIVPEAAGRKFTDSTFIKHRSENKEENRPVSICALPLSMLEGKYTYGELGVRLAAQIAELGYTHVLLTGVQQSMEAAGGERIPKDFFALTAAAISPVPSQKRAAQLQAAIELLHSKGIGVLTDFAPSRFLKNEAGLMDFDSTPMFETGDFRCDETPEGDTRYFAYGKPQVQSFLLSNMLYWVEKFHFDGLVVKDIARILYADYGKQEGQFCTNIYGGRDNPDGVSLLRRMNTLMQRRNPGVLMIAQDSSGWAGLTDPVEENGIGFSMKYHLTWQSEMEMYFRQDPLFRQGCHNLLIDHMTYQYAEQFLLPVIDRELPASFPGQQKEKYANLRLLLALQMFHQGKKLQSLAYVMPAAPDAKVPAGEEEKERKELAQGLAIMLHDLHGLYGTQSAMTAKDLMPDGFQWVRQMANDHCVISFLRRGRRPDDFLLILCNLANASWEEEIGVPYEGTYQEIFNTDKAAYGGSGMGNAKPLKSKPEAKDGRSDSICVTCPPLSLMAFAYKPE